MKKIALFAILVTIIYSCGSNDRGELIGVKYKRKWFSKKPLGMTLIPSGSFTMGKQDEDAVGTLSSPTKTVTVSAFYMDETEITNGEYKKFVYWVRDSVVRTKLAYKAEEAVLLSEGNADGTALTGGIHDFAFVSVDIEDANPYQKYMQENYYDIGEEDLPKPLNWKEDIIWNVNKYPDADYVEVMDSLHINKSVTSGLGSFNTDNINYTYSWFDIRAMTKSAEKKSSRKDFIIVEKVNIYPDTIVWFKDFSYSYNDPMHQDYFYHQAYVDYPVIGVNWHQARAFCNWRTNYRNGYLKRKKRRTVSSFRLPTEAEWEYAARGGLSFGKYPWGGPNTLDERGSFLANFKPVRGSYIDDGAMYTMKVKSFESNDYGLYNMAGNVSEWTNSAYNLSSYYIGSTINPNVEDISNNRKTIRGGSWKDVSYFLEVGSRDYEYADTARSYIGFRTVQSYLGVRKTK